MRTLAAVLAVIVTFAGSQAPVWANVFAMPSGQKSVEFVTVGDPGNAGDARFGRTNTTYPYYQVDYGAVGYTFQMGKYDVTSAQYCQFLNAVAKEDTYYVYQSSMAIGYTGACGIFREGDPGNYTYRVSPDRENFPVTSVTWASAARFVNWLSNGQPVGPQGPGTTESGTYALNGATSSYDILAVTRNPQARYAIPTEDEWYKAAYYKGGGTNAGYWLYPTQSDTAPSNLLDPSGTNNANYNAQHPDLLTPVGFFAGSPGPYGTYDQGGNVWQWNETFLPFFVGRGLRGGSWGSGTSYLHAQYWSVANPASFLGSFRIALVPEPATLSLLALGGLLIARRRRA